MNANYSEALEQQVAICRRLGKRSASSLSIGRNPKSGLFSSVGDDTSRDMLLWPLVYGEPVYWGPEFCDLLEQTAPSLPDWAVDVHSLIAESAFVWFAKPLALPRWTFDGEPMGGLAAIAWQKITQYYDPSFSLTDQLRIDTPRGEQAAEWLVITFYSQRLLTGRAEPLGAVPFMQGEQLVNLKIDQAVTDELVMASGATMGLMARYVGTAISFMHQRIVVAPHESVDRATRRRLSGDLSCVPTVRVVRLRRAVSRSGPTSTADMPEWSCRWVVSGHWRQHWFPKTEEHRWLWILPYVKGPDDKPLKPPRATVFAVVR